MQFHPLHIKAVHKETRDAIVVEFDVPEDLRTRFAYRAGQYLTVRTTIDGDEERRSYSICASPRRGVLRVGIKRAEDGVFSAWAHRELKAGDLLEVAPPQGRFFVALDAARPRTYLAFAAGSGITPVLALIEATLEAEPRSRFTLVYGNRSASSTMFREELQHLKDRYLDRLALIFITSREKQEIDLFNGRIDKERAAHLFERWIDLKTMDYVFLCGPESMMDAVQSALVERGFDRERVVVERFVTDTSRSRVRRQHAARKAEDDVCRATVTIDGTQRAFAVHKDTESILDAGLRQGIDLPFSCKGGICSSCRAQLTSGEVDMDVHFALEDYEVRAGVILMCQSHPVTNEVALDVDAIAAQLI